MKKYIESLKYDFPASIVVFLVAIPLCLGIALASGVPLLSGLIAGIVGGIVIGPLSKSHLSVSGPAAGLVVIVLNAIETLGTVEAFFLAVVIAGALQIILGFAKAGIIGLYFPNSVIKGMLAAIGLILILKQIPHLVGFDQDAFGEMKFIQADGSNTFSALLDSFQHMNKASLFVGVVSLLLMILWDRPFIQKNKTLGKIPAGILVVLIGAAINISLNHIIPGYEIHKSHLVKIPEISEMGSFSDIFITPDFSMLGNYNVYIVAVTLAIVASLETLLSIEAVDNLDPLKRRTPQNRELKAQGVGNMISGLIGGLPITAVIIRSSTNLQAGAKTKSSAIMHGFLLLGAVAVFPAAMNKIPLASLAAILIMVGYKLNKPAIYKHHLKLGYSHFIPFIVTISAILFTDLLIGITIGLGVGIFFILRENYQLPYFYMEKEHQENGKRVIDIVLSQHVSFLNKARLRLMLEELPENTAVEVDGTKTKFLNHDVLEILHNFKSTAKDKNIDYRLKNIPELKA